MATVSKEILENLGDIVKQFHTALTKGGAEGIKVELANCKCSNPFGMGVILSKWDNVLCKLDNVASKLKKGNSDDIIEAVTELSKNIADLQLFMAKIATEIGSFIPGPIGIVCSIALAIGCFAIGDISGGFLNLIGAIPGVKLAKFLPIGALKTSILNFKNVLLFRWGYKVSAFTEKAARHSGNFRFKESFDDYFSKTIKSSKEKLSKVGDKLEKSKEQILTKLDDGWNAAREDLQAEKSFEYMLNLPMFHY